MITRKTAIVVLIIAGIMFVGGFMEQRRAPEDPYQPERAPLANAKEDVKERSSIKVPPPVDPEKAAFARLFMGRIENCVEKIEQGQKIECGSLPIVLKTVTDLQTAGISKPEIETLLDRILVLVKQKKYSPANLAGLVERGEIDEYFRGLKENLKDLP